MRSAPRVGPGVVVLDHVNPTRTWLCAERESSYDVWEQIAGLPGDYPSVLFLCEHCRRPITRVVAYARHSSGPVEAVGYNGAVTTVHQRPTPTSFPRIHLMSVNAGRSATRCTAGNGRRSSAGPTDAAVATRPSC